VIETKTNETFRKIVLTAPETDFTDFYNNPIWPFFFYSTSQYAFGGFPNRVMSKAPMEVFPDGQAKLAPYGLRKMEAALFESGFNEKDIVTVHPRFLENFIGPETKVIGISAMNTNGLTYCDQTFTALVGFGTDSYNSLMFRKLMFNKHVHSSGAKIILGGAGAWQVQGKYCHDYFGIDSVVLGEGEIAFPQLVRDALDGKPLPPVVNGTPIRDAAGIPCIQNGSVYGIVEISRGCGRNCQFCSPTKRLRRDIPLSTIAKEIEINFRTREFDPDAVGGKTVFTPMGPKRLADLRKQQEHMIFLTTEDILLYQCHSPKFLPNTDAILGLVNMMVDMGVETFQPAHIALAGAASSPDTIAKMTEALSRTTKQGNSIVRGFVNYGKHKYIGVETGMETGSPRMIQKFMRGKCLPFTPEDWPDVVVQAFGVLNDNYWFPFTSLMIGMPEETDDDAVKTLELLDRVKNAKTFFAPMLFTALGDCVLRKNRSANLNNLSDTQKEIFVECWRHNAALFIGKVPPVILQFIRPCFGGAIYNLYYRWRHDRKFFKRFFNVLAFEKIMPITE